MGSSPNLADNFSDVINSSIIFCPREFWVQVHRILKISNTYTKYTKFDIIHANLFEHSERRPEYETAHEATRAWIKILKNICAN